MNTILGNALAFKTYRWLKVNETEILLPEIQGLPFREARQDKKEEMPVFDTFSYGISKDALDLNRNNENYFRLYRAAEGEHKDVGVVRLDMDDENRELFDGHDIIAEKNSSLRLVLDYSSQGEKEKIRNSLIRIWAKEGAKVELFIIQRENNTNTSLESVAVYEEANAHVHLSQYELGSGKLYTNFHSELVGDDSKGYVDSIYFGNAGEEMNLMYNMIHRGERTESDMLVNGALKQGAYKNFKANLDFVQGARDAVGSEEEYVVLLDDTVHSVSVPLMLCHEDQVEGNHAASAGKIDPDILFYLISRGIELKAAEALVIESKFVGAVNRLSDKAMEEEVWASVREIIKAGM